MSELLLTTRAFTPLHQPAARKSRSRLTPREREVLHWISEGKTNSAIAIILGISPATVKGYVEIILRKLSVENRTAAARAWLMSDAGAQSHNGYAVR